MENEIFMREALKLAKQALEYGEIPVGGMGITHVLTWLLVLLGSVYWVWGNTKLRDWLFYNQNS